MDKIGKILLATILCITAAHAWAGVTQANDPHANTPTDSSDGCGCGSSKGMPVYSFKSLLASLNIRDTPVGYTPPVGPKVYTTLTYNQRETDQPAHFDSFNLGQKWTLNWLSWIQDDPSSPGNQVLRYVAGGGGRTYSGYNPSTRTFAPESDNGAKLVMISQTPVSYELRFANGGKDIFSASNGATRYPRRVLLTRIVDPQGNALTLNYDSRLRLTSVTDALGQQTSFQYGDSTDPLLVTGITDPFGRHATLAYDATGRLSAITDVIGLKSSFAYDSDTFIKAMTTPYGTTTFAHTEGANGNSTELSIQATDPDGHTERTEYLPAAPGMPFSVAQAPSGMNIFNAFQNYRDAYYWDKDAFAAACTVSGGNTQCDYTKARMKHFMHLYPCCEFTSRVLEDVKYPLEGTIWYDYAGQAGPFYPGTLDKPSGIGRVLSDGSTQLTRYTYNAYGRVTQRIDPDGRETDYTYASNGIDLIQVQQKNGAGFDTLAHYTYNSQHEPLTATDAAGQTTTYTYNARGQRTAITDPLNETTSYTYDSNGYLTTVTNALGHTQHSYTYDADGRLASDTDSQGYTRHYSYDALDRLTAITYPDSTTRTYTWNKLDLATYTDRLGNTTQYAYDAERNLITVTDPLGQVTQYGYYRNGRLHTLTDANGSTTTWTRDLEARVIAKTYADGSQTQYAYDIANRLASRTDALGQVTQYAHTVDDRLAGINYTNPQAPTPSVSFAYDAAYPRLIARTDGQGKTAYQYYPAGVPGAEQLKSIQGTNPHDSLAYSYDALGRLATRTVDGAQDSYHYDAIGRLIGENNPLGDFTTAYLGETGQPTAQTIANVPYRINYQYETNLGDRRLKAILNDTTVNGVTQPVAEYTYTTKPEALILSRAENDSSSTGRHRHRHHGWEEGRHKGWEHAPHWGAHARQHGQSDQDDQAEQTDRDDSHRAERGDEARHDDDRGHEDRRHPDRDHRDDDSLLTTQYTYDNDLRLIGAQGHNNESYSYDGVGNITDLSTGSTRTAYTLNSLNQIKSAGSTHYRYDANGNLLNDGTHTYTWDAADRLVSITNTQSGHTSQFTYDGLSRRVSDTETDAGGTAVVTTLLWCGQTLCEKRDANDAVLARYYAQGEQHSGQPYFYAQDQVGSVTGLVDSTGKLVARVRYDSYGNIVSTSGTVLPDYRYAGLYYHQASGLELATYRAYDARNGRWLSRDPIRERGGFNLYTYVLNNPLTYIDPYGLWSFSFGAYAGVGGAILIGQDPSTGQWFYGGRLGIGLGGGASFDYQGKRPSGDDGSGCGHGTTYGDFINAGVSVFPYQYDPIDAHAGYDTTTGQGYHTGPLNDGGITFGNGSGFEIGGAFGAEVVGH